MGHGAVTVIKEIDGAIDPEYLKVAISKNPSCSGLAIAHGGDEPMEVHTNRGPADLGTLAKAQEIYKDKKMFFTFGNHPEGFPDDEMQPWTMLKDPNNEDLVVAFVDGEFPGFVKADSAYSSAFHFAYDFLQKEIHKIYMEVEGELPEFFKRLNSPSMKKLVAGHGNPRASITILAYDGTPLTYNKNDLFGDYPAFWTSNSLDYMTEEELEEQTKPDETVKEEPKAPVVPKRKNLLAKAEGDGDTPVQPASPVTKPGDKKKERDGEEKVMMGCPKNITKWSDVRDWYQKACGTIPGNYKERPQVPVLKSKLTNTQLQDLAPKITIASVDPVKMPAKPGDVKPETIPVTSPEKMPTSSEFFHIVPPEEIKKFFTQFSIRDDIKGAVDADGKPVVLSPEKLAGTEQRWSTFTEQSKIDLLQVVNWQDPALYLLVKEHPRFAFKLLKDLLRAYAVSKMATGTPATTVGVVSKKGKAA